MKRWFWRQSTGGRIAFIVSTTLAVALIMAVIINALVKPSIDARISEHYGYKVTGCHKMESGGLQEVAQADGGTVWECDEGIVTEQLSDGSFSNGGNKEVQRNESGGQPSTEPQGSFEQRQQELLQREKEQEERRGLGAGE